MRPERWFVVGIFLWAITALGPLGLAFWRSHHDPSVPFLIEPDGAAWIVVDRPFQANPRRQADQAFFVKPFELARQERLNFTVHAPGSWSLLLDGVIVTRGPEARWRDGVAVDLGAVEAGAHELAVEVRQPLGAVGLAVRGDGAAAALATPEGWLVTMDGSTRHHVRRAAERVLPDVSMAFPSTVEALALRGPVVLGVGGLVLLVHGLRRRRPWPCPPWQVVVCFGLTVVAVWTARALMLHPLLGFDASAHHAYLAFLLDQAALPTANDGWQMFQPPLFYALAAPLFAVGRALGGDWNVVLARLVPLLCGLGLTMILGQTLALTTTTTWARHRAFLVMTCLPMSLTMYRFNGNEPLAALLTAAAITLTLKLDRDHASRATRYLALGVLAGLATLAKVSAIVVAPTIALALLSAPTGERPWRGRAVGLLVVAGAFVTTCGWWFVRNLVLLGRPFVGGWDPSRAVAWWQDPGYRTAADFSTFGISLVRPVFSAVASVWDGLYSSFWFDGHLSGGASAAAAPPWNWTSLMASVPFSIVPSVLILVGIVVIVRRRLREGMVATGCVVAWLAAIVSLAITLPIFSTAKASYMLGIVPCFAILLAHGLDTLEKPLLRVAADVVIAVWLVLVLHGLW